MSKGKISISIPKTAYNPGETISGDVTLTLNGPVKAREFSISLIGDQRYNRRGTVEFGKKTGRNYDRVYDFRLQLDGEKEYAQGGQYHFEIKIPAEILKKPQMPEAMDEQTQQRVQMMQAMASIAGSYMPRPTQWYLLAQMDIPMGVDIKKTIDITIG